MIGRNAANLEPLAHELGAQWVAIDASMIEFESVVTAFSPIGGIVNCAGSVLLKPAHLATDADWSETLRANLTTAFRGSVRE